jgi:hypothetical protein
MPLAQARANSTVVSAKSDECNVPTSPLLLYLFLHLLQSVPTMLTALLSAVLSAALLLHPHAHPPPHPTQLAHLHAAGVHA